MTTSLTKLPVKMPPRWVRVRRGYAAPGIHGAGLAPRLQHRAEPFAGTLDDWHRHVATADSTLVAFDLEDDDCFEVAGHDTVYRRFGHVVSNVSVLSDQWLWVVDGTAHELLGTVATRDYADYCDIFESVADTFDPEPTRRSRSA